jgi:hypothetical protein
VVLFVLLTCLLCAAGGGPLSDRLASVAYLVSGLLVLGAAVSILLRYDHLLVSYGRSGMGAAIGGTGSW